MDNQNKIRAYFSGELPLEEAQAFEQAIQDDPELALEVQMYELEHRSLPEWNEDQLDMEVNGWLPGLDILRESGVPLWLMSLLAGTMVVGMAGARSPKKKKGSAASATRSQAENKQKLQNTAGRNTSDEDNPPGGSTGQSGDAHQN